MKRVIYGAREAEQVIGSFTRFASQAKVLLGIWDENPLID